MLPILVTLATGRTYGSAPTTTTLDKVVDLYENYDTSLCVSCKANNATLWCHTGVANRAHHISVP